LSRNVETVRRACAAWGTGDISIYREMYAPDVTIHAGMFAPEVPGGRFTGVDQVMNAFESLMKPFESQELIPERFVEEGDCLVVPVVVRAVPRGSSARIEWPLVIAYRFRDGLIAHQAWYSTVDEALESLGLPPQSEANRNSSR
jgi:ketosteroid isomerase-like protein